MLEENAAIAAVTVVTVVSSQMTAVRKHRCKWRVMWVRPLFQFLSWKPRCV